MKRAHHGWFRLLASACLWTGAAACHDLFNLDEHPQTFVDPASYFKTGDQVIRRANDVLGQLDRVSLGAALTTRLRGEAHFLRGYAYFELVRRYGAVPL